MSTHIYLLNKQLGKQTGHLNNSKRHSPASLNIEY